MLPGVSNVFDPTKYGSGFDSSISRYQLCLAMHTVVICLNTTIKKCLKILYFLLETTHDAL